MARRTRTAGRTSAPEGEAIEAGTRGLFGQAPGAAAPAGGQFIPVNIFETSDGVEVVAPLPGLEPEDIEVNITDSNLTIRGIMRGVGQERKSYLTHEWTYGPYFRHIELPLTVDAAQARVTFGNGVLTLTLPRALLARPRTIRLRDVAFAGRFGSPAQDQGEPGIAEFKPEEGVRPLRAAGQSGAG